MTTKLHRIKSALRESIEIASKATPGPWFEEEWSIFGMGGGSIPDTETIADVIPWPDIDEPDEHYLSMQQEAVANAKFLAHARTMTPLACKALLTAIEGLESMIHDPEYGDEMCDNDGRGCRACDTAYKALESITAEWPDV